MAIETFRLPVLPFLLICTMAEVTDLQVISHFLKKPLCFRNRGLQLQNGDEIAQVNLHKENLVSLTKCRVLVLLAP